MSEKTAYHVVRITGTEVFTDLPEAKKQYEENFRRLQELNMISNVYPALWAVTTFDDGMTVSIRYQEAV